MEQKSPLVAIVIALSAIIIALAIVLSVPKELSIVSDSGGVQRNTINVAGSGSVTVSPDEAEVYIAIQTEEPTARQAQQNNARLSTQVMDALKAAGVDDDEIETSSFNIYPYQEWNHETQKYETKKYRADNVLKVTTDDVTGVGDLIDAATSNGATGINNVQFKLSKDKQKDANEQAIARASSDARTKAEAITQGLGVRLGDIVTITESNVYYTPYNYYPRALDMAGASAEMAKTDIQPENLEISASISLVYEIS